MTKIVLKINCGDSNPPVLAENLPFFGNISGLPFLHNILLVFETVPSQRKIMISFCLTSLFNTNSMLFLDVFLWFLSDYSFFSP